MIYILPFTASFTTHVSEVGHKEVLEFQNSIWYVLFFSNQEILIFLAWEATFGMISINPLIL